MKGSWSMGKNQHRCEAYALCDHFHRNCHRCEYEWFEAVELTDEMRKQEIEQVREKIVTLKDKQKQAVRLKLEYGSPEKAAPPWASDRIYKAFMGGFRTDGYEAYLKELNEKT